MKGADATVVVADVGMVVAAGAAALVNGAAVLVHLAMTPDRPLLVLTLEPEL